jgi:hypothetical protein
MEWRGNPRGHLDLAQKRTSQFASSFATTASAPRNGTPAPLHDVWIGGDPRPGLVLQRVRQRSTSGIRTVTTRVSGSGRTLSSAGRPQVSGFDSPNAQAEAGQSGVRQRPDPVPQALSKWTTSSPSIAISTGLASASTPPCSRCSRSTTARGSRRTKSGRSTASPDSATNDDRLRLRGRGRVGLGAP